MISESTNLIFSIILSLLPFLVVGCWLVYKLTESKRSLNKNDKKIIRVGDNNYIVKEVPRILVVEKQSGLEAIVTTCGVENEQQRKSDDMINLPKLIKVRYKMRNGIFSPEESDWVAGENFDFIDVRQVDEYEQV